MRELSILALTISAGALLHAAPVSAGPTAPIPTDFAKCAVAQYEGAELLATQPGSEEEADVLAEFARRACRAPAQQTSLLRGAVAEQLFKTDFGILGARPKREAVEVFGGLAPDEMADLSPDDRGRLFTLALGTCVAASDPGKSVALLKTPAASASEASIITELEPAFAPCLWEGERLDLGKAQLRGAIAEGVYRLAVAYAAEEKAIVVTGQQPGQEQVCKKTAKVGTRVSQDVCLSAKEWNQRERADREKAQEFIRDALMRQAKAETRASLGK